MERDWELIRKILLGLAQLADSSSILSPEEVSGYSTDLVSYHMQLLRDGGFIQARDMEINAGICCVATRLTWEGHELLSRMHDQTMWNRVKKTVRDKGLSLSFEVIKAAANIVIGAMMKP